MLANAQYAAEMLDIVSVFMRPDCQCGGFTFCRCGFLYRLFKRV